MPHKEEYKYIQVKELHPTFGAEVEGVNFSKEVPDGVFAEILAAITKAGVLVFRKAGLDDHRHVAFARKFGELDDVKPYLTAGRKNRFPYDELFDVSNLEDDGSIAQPDGKRDAMGKGNSLFHVDSSFNPRRAGFSLLRSHILPPKETGGSTDFADTRAAWDALPEEELLEKDYVVGHSLWHSRKKASPGSAYLKDIEPRKYFISRHKLVQTHERSGRKNLYIAAHAMQAEAPTTSPPAVGLPGPLLPQEEAEKLLNELWLWAQRPQFVLKVDWENEGDLVVWDNTCVMHRAGAGTFHGKYKRDMRRATVHDSSPTAWGLNEESDIRMGLP